MSYLDKVKCTKFRGLSKEQCQRVQENLFLLGVTWPGGEQKPMFLDSPSFVVSSEGYLLVGPYDDDKFESLEFVEKTAMDIIALAGRYYNEKRLAEDMSPHYRTMSIEPIDYAMKNGLDFFEGNIVKYVSRYKFKNGVKDLYKARDYLDRLIRREEENE